MKSFSYNAYDSQGVKTSGVLEAASHAEAKILLTEKRLFIVDLREIRPSEFNSGLHVRKKVTAKELEFLTQYRTCRARDGNKKLAHLNLHLNHVVGSLIHTTIHSPFALKKNFSKPWNIRLLALLRVPG